jgi:phosphohistidine phosphatase
MTATGKRLTLIRHAKSSWDNVSIKDSERALTRRGEKDAARIGQWLQKQHWRPDALRSSTALRALMTSKIIASCADLTLSSLGKKKKLYLAEEPQLLEFIAATPDTIQHLAIVAHNPGLLDLINTLTNSSLLSLPTCAVHIIDLPCASWQQIGETPGKTVVATTPKKLR